MADRRHDLAASAGNAGRIGAGVRDRLAVGRADRVLVRAPADCRRDLRSLRQDDERAAPRGAGADFRVVAWARHLVESRARHHAGVLRGVLQRLSGRQGSQHHAARQCADAWHERAAIAAPCLLAVGAVVDVFIAAYFGGFCRGRRRSRRISGFGGGARLFDPAGRRRIRCRRRVCRHDRAGDVRGRDRFAGDQGREPPAGLASECG